MWFSIRSLFKQKIEFVAETNASGWAAAPTKVSTATPEDSAAAATETKEFRDSTAFLKGTQSLNPHNDYSQNFVDTGHRPQNFIRDVGLADRFEVRYYF